MFDAFTKEQGKEETWAEEAIHFFRRAWSPSTLYHPALTPRRLFRDVACGRALRCARASSEVREALADHRSAYSKY